MKRIVAAVITGMVSVQMCMTAFAGGWQQDVSGWWYDNGDGTWPAGTWQWIAGVGGTENCYYFDEGGYLLTDTVTPDGCAVNPDGAWMVDGIVQVREVGGEQAAESASDAQSQLSFQAVYDALCSNDFETVKAAMMREDFLAACAPYEVPEWAMWDYETAYKIPLGDGRTLGVVESHYQLNAYDESLKAWVAREGWVSDELDVFVVPQNVQYEFTDDIAGYQRVRHEIQRRDTYEESWTTYDGHTFIYDDPEHEPYSTDDEPFGSIIGTYHA